MRSPTARCLLALALVACLLAGCTRPGEAPAPQAPSPEDASPAASTVPAPSQEGLPAGPTPGAPPPPPAAPSDAPAPDRPLPVGRPGDLVFTPDPGVRVANATNASVRVADGIVELAYEDLAAVPPQPSLASSPDGLAFAPGGEPSPYFRALRLPNGSMRAYEFRPGEGLVSHLSTDGRAYVREPGVRHLPAGNGALGAYDLHHDGRRGVVLLYVGDVDGSPGVRRAVSADDGWTFAEAEGDVFDGFEADGAGRYEDPAMVELPDGRVRAFVTKDGKIFSFTSRDDARTFRPDPGVVLDSAAFADGAYRSLHGPQPLLLPDGRVRLYVTAVLETGAPGAGPEAEPAPRHVVSAVSEG